jgi:hypothetical protein
VVAINATNPRQPTIDHPALSGHTLFGRSFAYLPDATGMPSALYFAKHGGGPVTTFLWQPFLGGHLTAGPAKSDGETLKGAPVHHAGPSFVIPESAGAVAPIGDWRWSSTISSTGRQGCPCSSTSPKGQAWSAGSWCRRASI